MELKIKEVAKAHNLSLNDLAIKLNITRQSLYQHCIGNPSADVLMRIADAIGCNISELFGEPHASCKCPHCGKPINISIS